MSILIGILCGTGLGSVLPLIPGLHAALGLTLLLGLGLTHWLGGLGTGCLIASCAGSSLYIHRIASVYHPAAGGGEVASLDPALRFSMAGKGPDAVKIMKYAIDLAWIPFGVMTSIVVVCSFFHINMVELAKQSLSWLSVPVIMVWIIYTCYRSAKPLNTVIGFVLTGLFGYVTLHHPALRGNEHALAPVMAGLFGIPMMWLTLQHRAHDLLPAQVASDHLSVNPLLGWYGGWLGVATGFFAGLGSSSIAGLAASVCEDDGDYLLMVASSEAVNDIISLLLMLAAGMSRSGEAALVGQALPAHGGSAPMVIIMALVLGAWYGRSLMPVIEPWYINFISKGPRWLPSSVDPFKFWAVLVIGFSVFQVLLTGQYVISLTLMVIGVMLSLWSRTNHLPLQVSFAALAVPIIIQNLGLVSFINPLLFGG